MQFYFSDNPLLQNLEQNAKSQGLQFIDELIFENGAVYKGKSIGFLKEKGLFISSAEDLAPTIIFVTSDTICRLFLRSFRLYSTI